MTGQDLSSGAVERVGQSVTIRARMWPRGQRADAGVVEVVEAGARAAPVASLLVEAQGKDGPRFSALVHGYGCSCAEEVELWEKPGLVLVGLGQSVVVLDSRTGQVRLRVPMGGYFNSLWLAEDGRDAFICGDEQVIRLVPPGVISWQKTLGVDGVMVHRAVGVTVFASAQRKVGAPWSDFLLDRMTGNVVEAPEPDEEETAQAARPAARQAAVQTKPASAVKKPAPRAVPAPEPDDEEEVDDASVRMVRDDETDPDDD